MRLISIGIGQSCASATAHDGAVMSNDILTQLSQGGNPDAEGSWSTLAATPAQHPQADRSHGGDEKLDSLLQRIEQLAQKGSQRAPTPVGSSRVAALLAADPFVPLQKRSFAEMELSESQVEALVLKYLLARGDAVGREIAEQVRLPFGLIDELLRRMKQDQLLVYRGSAELNDYLYQLTDFGRERARRQAQICSYFGAAPVSLAEYIESVSAQSLIHQKPKRPDLERAFEDMLVSSSMLDRLGPAVNSGRGMFLYGAPGNGKTSIARRVSLSFGKFIWIPRALGVDGEIIRVFDPLNHVEAPFEKGKGLLDETKIDQRWVRVYRPTIVVGGELTMAHLEITQNPTTNICEAPLQLKSNCGTLVIDDFGRQRIRTDELLNRWIVPLEERIDFLSLPNGKTIQVPFDQLIVFSTNLEPRDLVDEAFLRRIAYKIEVSDPSEGEFRELFKSVAGSMKIDYDDDAVTHLLEQHYRPNQRSLRCCHPRDLLRQVENHCVYQGLPLAMTRETLDFAVMNYFAVM